MGAPSASDETISDTAATITWATNFAADSQIEYGTTPDLGSSTALDVTLVTSHSVTLSGLSPGTTYYYRVRSEDPGGDVAVSGILLLTTDAGVIPPVVSDVAVASIADDGASISWTTDVPTTIQFDYGTTVAYGTQVLDAALTLDHVAVLTGLDPETTYHFRAGGRNEGNTFGSSGDLTFTTAAAPDTTGPVLSSLSQSTTDTTATPHCRTDEPAKVTIEYGTTTGYGTTTPTPGSYALVHDIPITGLTQNTLYHYRFHAIDAAGNETISSDRTWTTALTPDVTAPVISADSGSAIGTTAVRITWTTDEAADSQVEYGATAAYGSTTTLDGSLVTSHSVDVTGLSAGETIHFRVLSRDSWGNLATGSDRTATTAEAAPETWEDTDPPTGTTTSAITFHATEESLGYDVLYTEGAVTLQAVTAEFRLNDGTNRRDALDAWPTRPTSGNKNVYGSLLLLTGATTYQLRLRFFWSDGTSSYRVGTNATRTISIPDPATLTPDRYVDPVNGNDANAGTSAGTAWKTYAKFASAYPTGGTVGSPKVVKVLSNGASVFLGSASQLLNRGTVHLISDAPPVDDAGATAVGGKLTEVAAASGRVTIEPVATTAPTGATITDSWVSASTVWEPVNLVGPGLYGNTPGTLYPVYKWVGCPTAAPTQGSYCATRDGKPNRIPHCTRTHADLNTPEKWAEALATNKMYRQAGFYSDDAGAGTTTLYVKLPDDADPRDYWMWFGSGGGVDFRSAGSRLSGFSVHTFSQAVNTQSSGGNFIIDHNILRNSYRKVQMTSSGNADAVIEFNLIEDSNLWASQTALVWDDTVISWGIVKEALIMADGSTTVAKWMLNSEVQGVYFTSGGRRGIVRYNTIRGSFDGISAIGAASNSSIRTNGDNCDVHNNYIEQCADDAFQPENSVINWRQWDNTVRECLAGVSIAPLHYGPMYLFRNTYWKLGSMGVGRNIDGTTRPSGKGIKMSSTNAPEARIYVIHETYDIDQTDPNSLHGFGTSNTGSTYRPGLWMKNSILTATLYVIDAVTNGRFVEDFNFFATEDTTRGIRVGVALISTTPTDYDNTGAGTTFAAYRAATGQGANSNLVGATTKEVNDPAWMTQVRAMFTDRSAGDLTLALGAAALEAGTPIPNISDRAGVDYTGAAPNLGHQP